MTKLSNERRDLRAHFLRQYHWRPETAQRLTADASFRSYYRIQDQHRRMLLMDAPPPLENIQSFIKVAEHLRNLGLSTPEIYAADINAGLLLLEDFGDLTYTHLLDQGAAPEPLYRLAVDVLIALQKNSIASAIDLPPYDEALLVSEAARFVDWYLPVLRQQPTTMALRAEYLELWRQLVQPMLTRAPTLVMRDFHIDNLMQLPERDGVRACGLLDFQDAVLGHPAYDLVSLLEDARCDVPDFIVQAMRSHYRQAFPNRDWMAFNQTYALLGVQRHCKVIGLFMRLFLRDNKPSYLKHIPRVVVLLNRGLAAPFLQPLRDWLDCYANQRSQPLAKLDRSRLLKLIQAPDQ